MKKIITLMLALLPLVAFSQQPTNPLPHNVLTPQDTTIKLDHSAYQASADMSMGLHSAGQSMINSVLFDILGVATFAIASDVAKKDTDSANALMAIGGGFVAVGLIMLISAGMDLKSSAKSSIKIHPIPSGVSIDLD